MKKLKGLIFLIVVLALVCTSLCSCSSKKIEHRLEWWLGAINWEDKDRNKLNGEGITIALIDSGVENHRDLKCRIEENIGVDGIDCSLDDYKTHGTAMAGVIAAWPTDEHGLLGVAPKSKIISIDVTNDEDGNVKTQHLTQAIDIAVEKQVDIINISISIAHDDKALHTAIKRAYDCGIVIVASAGNVSDISSVLYPACYQEVICVGAYSKDFEYLYPQKESEDIIYLPGQNIVSCDTENSYSSYTGTSIAAAIFSGIVALIKQYHPNISPYQIQQMLKSQPNHIIKNIKDLLEVKYD